MNLQTRIEKLKIGQSFTVKSDTDRKRALEIGKARGLALTSKRRFPGTESSPAKKGGFRITRLMND